MYHGILLARSTISFNGLCVATTPSLRAGDIANLELVNTNNNNAYVRSRCYHANCSLGVAETDRFDAYKSTSGKTYLRFWTFEVIELGDKSSTPSRSSPTSTGQAGEPVDWAGPHSKFVPGAGGCIEVAGGSQDPCLESLGFYTDDDATLIGTHCRCGADRYATGLGTCTAI